MRNTAVIVIYIGSLLSILLLSAGASPVYSQELKWLPFEKALITADTSNRSVLVDVWAPWCGWCRKLKQEVYPALAPELSEHFVLTRINRDNNEAVYRYRGQKLTSIKLAQKLRAQQVPAIVLLNSKGNYLLHLTGYLDEKELRPVLEYVSTNAYERQSFEAFQKERGF